MTAAQERRARKKAGAEAARRGRQVLRCDGCGRVQPETRSVSEWEWALPGDVPAEELAAPCLCGCGSLTGTYA